MSFFLFIYFILIPSFPKQNVATAEMFRLGANCNGPLKQFDSYDSD